MIDWTKPLQTNVPGEVAIPLRVKFGGRQLVQITEPSGAQGLYLANDNGHILRLSVKNEDAAVCSGPVLKNKHKAVDLPEFFFNVFDTAEMGFIYSELRDAYDAVKNEARTRVACVGVKIDVSSDGHVVKNVRTFPV